MTEPMPTGLDPAPPSADRGADAPAVLEALVPAPIVCLPHVGAMLPLRLRSAPAGPLRLRLQWRDGGLARETLIELPDGPPGERELRVELDGGDLQPARYGLLVAAETRAGARLAELTLTAELHDFASVPPSAPVSPDTLRRRSLATLPPVPLGAAPPEGDARIVLRGAVPTPRAAWEAGDLEARAAAGIPRKPLTRIDLCARFP